MKKSVFSGGAVSIVLSFVILALIAFGALSLSTAQAGMGYAQATAENTTAYYEACTQAEQALAGLTSPPESGGERWGRFTEENGKYRLTVPVSREKSLVVVIAPAQDENRPYVLESFSTEPSGAWEGEYGLKVLE